MGRTGTANGTKPTSGLKSLGMNQAAIPLSGDLLPDFFYRRLDDDGLLNVG